MKYRRKARRFSPRQRQQLVQEFRGSQVSVADFARRQGIAPTTVYGWLRQASAGKRNSSGAGVGFVEIDIPQHNRSSVGLVVDLSGEVCVRLDNKDQIPLLAALVQELRGTEAC